MDGRVEHHRQVLPMTRRPLTLEEEAALAITYRALFPVLRRYATRLVGLEDAEDIIQEAMLKYLIQREREADVDRGPDTPHGTGHRMGQGAGHDTGYDTRLRLIAMVKDEALDHVRNTRRESRLKMLVTGATAAIRRRMSATRRSDGQDIVAAIHAALAQVRPSYREAWLMVREFGMSVTEAAQLQQVKPATIRAAVSAANADLHRLLQLQGVTPKTMKGRTHE